MNLNNFRTVLDQRKGQKIQIEESIKSSKKSLKEKKTDLIQHEKARELIREAGLKTQQSLSFHISEITSLALESVFAEKAYKLEVEFVERRNKTECDLYFTRNLSKETGEYPQIDPMTGAGGGAVDVTTFALRIASWSMQNPRCRNVIILDEPLKNLSKEYQEKGSMMLKEVSKRLGIQFIIVTHEEVLTSFADKTFTTSIKNGITTIK